MARFAGRTLLAIALAAMFAPCLSSSLYFTTGWNPKISIEKIDLSSSTHQKTTMLEYPMGPYNRGGGGTGICRLGNTLYWGDQTTCSVHSADLTDGKLTNHNSSFIANMSDPQGVACDAVNQKVYIIDISGVYYRSPKPGSSTMNLNLVGGIGQYRSMKVVDGNVWFGADGGIFRSTQNKPGEAEMTKVVYDGRIYEDFEVVEVKGKKPLIFASTYNWSGVGVLESELNEQHQSLTSPFQQMKGGGCKQGSELTWGLAADANANTLYWAVGDDADPSNVKIMYKKIDSSDPPKVAYSAVGRAADIYVDPDPARTLVV